MKTAAIVDPFSTGEYLAPELRSRGWQAVAVLSSAEPPGHYKGKLRDADFSQIIVHDGDVGACAKALADCHPEVILPGNEIGVELADLLAEKLGLPGNGTRLSRARRDKAAMVNAVRAAGLRVADTLRTDSLTAAAYWAESKAHWPVVVKPVDSAGADGVTFCENAAELADAFGRVHGARNRTGQLNTHVLIQELLVGQQYFVNTVSYAGKHYVCEIWQDTRHRVSGAGLVCDREDLLPATGNPQDGISEYVTQVLDALEIAWGAAHTEIMLTESGPVLIESAARMQGTIAPEAVRAATGENHVTASVTAATDPAGFMELRRTRYPLRRNLSVVSLISPRDGMITSDSLMAKLTALPTVDSVLGELAAGSKVQRTVDLFTSPGFLYLIADTHEEIERDYARIREFEANGLYA